MAFVTKFLKKLGFMWDYSEKSGVIAKIGEPFEHSRDGTGGSMGMWARIYLQQEPELSQGWCAVDKLVNRIEEGDRVKIKIRDSDGWIFSIKPLDKKLKWYQH